VDFPDSLNLRPKERRTLAELLGGKPKRTVQTPLLSALPPFVLCFVCCLQHTPLSYLSTLLCSSLVLMMAPDSPSFVAGGE
jgi:1,4-dihydroxy-2-naphthoate octaprenyltransferase